MADRTIADRLFELALFAFPRDFRDRWEDELRAEFEVRREDGRQRTPVVRALALVGVLGDMVLNGLLQRWAARRGRSLWTSEWRILIRSLGRRPAFTAQAVLTVALGAVGLTTVYPILHRTVLRPLPYEEPERLVAVRTTLDQDLLGVTPPELLLLKQQADLFQGVAAVLPPEYDRSFVWTDGTPREPLRALQATPDLFRVLGVDLSGPGYDPSPGGADEVVLSHGFWERRFGEQDVVGRAMSLNDRPFTVVGVLPEGFELPLDGQDFDVWPVFRIDPTWPASMDNRVYRMVARMAEGASVEGVAARVPDLLRDFHDREATGIHIGSTHLRSLHEDLVGAVRLPLLLLTAGAILVLVVAALNLSLLLAARNLARDAELGVRRALGAGEGRLARFLLMETGALAALGALGGLGLSRVVLRVLEAVGGEGLGRGGPVSEGLGLIPWMAGGAVLAVALGAGIVPALSAARGARLGSRSRSRSKDAHRTIAWVVGVESAVVFALLVAAGLTVMSLDRILSVDPGFRAEGAVAVGVRLPDDRYDRTGIPAFFEAAAARLEGLPGVVAVGSVTHLPLEEANWGGSFAVEGREGQDPGSLPLVDWEFASPSYFEAAGIPLLEGRPFTTAEHADGSRVAIINQTLARRFWPEGGAIGSRVNGNGFDGNWFTVVGVVGDVKQQGLEDDSRGYMYMASNIYYDWLERQLVIRTASTNPTSLVPEIRQALLEMEPSLTIGTVTSMEGVVERASGAFRLRALVFGSLGLIAVLLGMAGIHGVASHGVQARMQEVGVRLALGADQNGVFRMVVVDGLRPVLLGMTAGATLALWAGGWLDSFLYGIDARSPLVLVGIATVLVASALAAIVPPALRARSLDPVELLQE